MNIHVFTHIDLDGATSYLMTCWYHDQPDISYTTINNSSDVREGILKWALNHKFEDYDLVYILDIDCYDAKDLIDKPNVRIFDHHKSHQDKIHEKGKYTKCKAIVKEYSSCSLLLYKIFTKIKTDLEISKYQKVLIKLVDDYDSYSLKVKESKYLNWVYTSYNNWFESYIHRFYDGFTGFTIEENNMIKIVKNRIKDTLMSMPVYQGVIDGHTSICIFIEKDVNEVIDIVIDKYKPDICIAVLPHKQKVSWRTSNHTEVPIHKYAEIYTDGGGHEYAAGGVITAKFLQLSKGFNQIKNEFTN